LKNKKNEKINKKKISTHVNFSNLWSSFRESLQ
jgi:hypothetical protein